MGMATVVHHSVFHVERVLSKAKSREPLTRAEIRFLLGLRKGRDLARLFQAAGEMRRRYFGEGVFLYGFVYFSTWCRNNCIFCRYRRSNPLARRYRKNEQEIVEIACRLAESGVHLIDLTMGEDPFFNVDGERIERLLDLIREVKGRTGLPVMISPGVVHRKGLEAFRETGVDWYACYQETHNRKLFGRLRPGQDYDERLMSKVEARQVGLLIEEGILAGVSEGLDDIAASMEAMKSLGAHQLRVMTFVPQEGTPLEKTPPPPARRELVTIALIRLLFPERLIPASLDVRGIRGLQDRLGAGANVVTSLIPPRTGLVGVSQSALDVEEGYRTVKGVVPVVEGMGLRVATGEEYARWILRENDPPHQDRQMGRVP